MAIYNQQTPLSRGGVAPSVNYNAAIRMPTQPMPDLPDVNASFNIDLRPIGEAILAGKEMEWRSQEAELDRQARERELAKSFENQVALKQMELESIEKRHADENRLGWYNAETNRMKVEKENKEDTVNTLKRDATDFLIENAKVLDADIRAGLKSSQIPLRERQIVEAFRNRYGQTVLISDVIDAVRKVYGGFLGSMGAESRAQTKSLEESQNTVEDQFNSTASSMSAYNGLTVSANRKIMAKYTETRDNIDRLQARLSRTDLSTDERELAQKELDTAVSYIGGERVNNYLNSLSAIQLKDYNTLKQAKDMYIQTVMSEGYPQQVAEMMWNMEDSARGYTRGVEAASQMNDNILKQYERDIKTLVAGNQIGLLKNIPGLATFSAIRNISPELAESFMNAANFEDIISALGSNTALTITDAGNGSFIVKHGDKEVELRPDQVKAIRNSTGIEDLPTAFMSLHSKEILRRVNSGAEPSLNFAADMMTPKSDSVGEALTVTQNTVNLAKNINPKTVIEYAKTHPQDRGAQTFVASLKIQDYLDRNYSQQSNVQVLFNEFTSKIQKMRVNGFLSDWIKGGTIEIRTDDKGKVHLWRTAEGIGGGIGFIEGYMHLNDIENFLNNIDLTAEERVSFLETHLGKGYFYTYPKGDMPTIKDYAGRVIDMLQYAVALPIDLGAGGDTALAATLSSLAKATDFEDVTKIYRGFLDKRYKEMNRKNTSNAPLISERTVHSLSEMEQAINEDSKLKKKPAEPEGDIVNPVQIPTGVVRKKEPVEAELPDADEIIAVTSY